MLTLFSVFKASWAAKRAGSAFLRSRSQSICFAVTVTLISATFTFSTSA